MTLSLPSPVARVRDRLALAPAPPVVLAYGIGVDSTALLVELEARGTPPDLVLSADPGAEKPDLRLSAAYRWLDGGARHRL